MSETVDGWRKPHRWEQMDLWPTELDRFVAKTRVSLDEIERWRERGWISFDVQEKTELHTSEVFEIQFVRCLAYSGLSDAMIEELLEGLEKPYCYNPFTVAYSFLLGWVERPRIPNEDEIEEIIETNLEDWFKECARQGDSQTLYRIKELADNAFWEALETRKKQRQTNLSTDE